MFDLADPQPDMVHLDDIVAALGKINRYTGHTVAPYSVAQHCLVVARLCPPEKFLHGLLHDAPEAYVGDVSSPLKSMLPQFKEIEGRVAAAIAERFGVDYRYDEVVKDADLLALFWERRDLMQIAVHGRPWFDENAYVPRIPLERLFPMPGDEAATLWRETVLAHVPAGVAR